jgi:hypothetical protein
MKGTILAVAVAAVMAVTGSASAQEIYYPGSVWTSNGNLTPAEKGNLFTQTHVEQGVAFRGAEVFGQTTLGMDSKGYDWNRKMLGGVGARFTQTIGPGMVRASVSYVSEKRFVTDAVHSGIVVAVEAWFGWNQSPRPQGGK